MILVELFEAKRPLLFEQRVNSVSLGLVRKILRSNQRGTLKEGWANRKWPPKEKDGLEVRQRQGAVPIVTARAGIGSTS